MLKLGFFSMAVADGLVRTGAEYSEYHMVSTLFTFATTDSDGNTLRAYETFNSTITLCREGWCSQAYLIGDAWGLVMLNGIAHKFRVYYTNQASTNIYENVTGSLLYYTFLEPADSKITWTQISFLFKWYGYGWGFDTVTFKLATAILIIHAVIIIVHCCYIAYSGLSNSSISSLGDLVALAPRNYLPRFNLEAQDGRNPPPSATLGIRNLKQVK